MSHIEMHAYVLCAGRQERYGKAESKMMVQVNGKPAISHSLDTLVSVFPEDRISVVSSPLFPDLNDFLKSTYPYGTLLIDDDPGRGTANSLSKTFPWKTDQAFVTEGDIYYLPQLIKNHQKISKENPDAKVIFGLTPHTNISSTHRGVRTSPQLSIEDQGEPVDIPSHRNIGAHILHSSVIEFLDPQRPNVIDVIRYMYSVGESVIASIYLQTLLHLAESSDVQEWEEYFKKNIR